MPRRITLVALAALLLLAASPIGSARASVSAITSNQVCSAGGVDVTLGWLSDGQALEQYVYLADAAASWSSGSYLAYGPFEAGSQFFMLPAMPPGASFLAAIAEHFPDGTWLESAPSLLTTIGCGQPALFASATSAAFWPTTYFASAGQNLNQQPIDWFVGNARAAMYQPDVLPPLVDAYPHIPNTYTYQTCTDNCPTTFGVANAPAPPSSGNPNPNNGNCDPAYTNVCLTPGVHYNCLGGTGKPPYIQGPVYLRDPSVDPSDLDGDGTHPRDHDGIGCNGV